jgi:hypothetical protein
MLLASWLSRSISLHMEMFKVKTSVCPIRLVTRMYTPARKHCIWELSGCSRLEVTCKVIPWSRAIQWKVIVAQLIKVFLRTQPLSNQKEYHYRHWSISLSRRIHSTHTSILSLLRSYVIPPFDQRLGLPGGLFPGCPTKILYLFFTCFTRDPAHFAIFFNLLLTSSLCFGYYDASFPNFSVSIFLLGWETRFYNDTSEKPRGRRKIQNWMATGLSQAEFVLNFDLSVHPKRVWLILYCG